ncbi:polyketide synthase [Blumeria hordei DH14]|uniref:Polyketide synthase n=1 Tax=Blumeria graminis f. sp. hordei (strain DH14) TaxID=546991 RepID=N1J7B9_BLUG1|nr:polyketide synthase [Blumeria hordei DH14]
MSNAPLDLFFCSCDFPDDDKKTLQLFRQLQSHSRKSSFSVLSSFLSECAVVLRAEVAALPRSYRHSTPDFQSLLNLATPILGDAEYEDEPLHVPLRGALLCALQIALLIGNFEAEKVEYDLPRRNTVVAGIRVGMFAAVAIATSSSIIDLASIGPESVRMAFRLQIHVDQISRLIESPPSTQGKLQNWAYTITQTSEADILEEISRFNTSRACSELTKIRICHVDQNSVGVTGPESRVKAFLKSCSLCPSSCLPLPNYGGLCHAAEVYGDEDVESIIGRIHKQRCSSRPVYISLLSPSTGEPFPAENAISLFSLVCKEILTEPYYHCRLVKGLSDQVSISNSTEECRFFSYGTSIVHNILQSPSTPLSNHNKIVPHNLLEWTTRELNSEVSHSDYSKSKLVVVGMSCRMPGGANDTELLFQLLTDGRDVHTKIPADRFDVETHYDPTGNKANASETPFGNFIDNPGFFDAGFFNISPREAEQTDPMHRLALITAYEALEMAGFTPNRTQSTNLKRVGTYYGVASDDYREANAGQNIDTYATPGGERAFANGRINYYFKFGGPSFNIDTACSSSGAAINAACSSLWSGEIDMAIAGGLNVMTNPDNYCMLSKGHFLSKTGQCKVWSKDADGYCRADGIGSIVIKRLEDAIADNDRIIAMICAAATNHSANAVSITQPHVGAQKENYNQILQDAGVDPLDVSYVELHGTGTQVGDGVESKSVADVFAPLEIPRQADNPLYLGAIKSNIGHGEAAAGVASIIKVLLAFEKNQIPRNIFVAKDINPTVAANIRNRNARMVTENISWPRRPEKKRYAVVNSFGAHGGNTSFLFEEAPLRPESIRDPRNVFVVAVSAKSKNSLRGNLTSLLRYLDITSDVKLGDLSYTLCARRIHYQNRVATSATTIIQVRKFIESALIQVDSLRPIPVEVPPIAFAFSGQGAFYERIGQQLFNYFPSFRDEVLRLDHLSQQIGFPSIISALTGSTNLQVSGPLVVHLTLVIVGIALARFWERLGVKPDVVIGHSLGEYPALVSAGVLSAADAIFLVGKRAEILLETCTPGTHCMLSIRASVETIERLTDKLPYEIACLNSPADTVISGSLEQIQKIQELVELSGLKCNRLEIPFAFHSSQLDPMLDHYEKLAGSVTFNPPSIPVISPLLGACVTEHNIINARYMRRATREPVNFLGALLNAKQIGAINSSVTWIDVSPHPVCTSFLQCCAPASKICSTLRRNEENFTNISRTLVELHLQGIPVSWNDYFESYEKAHSLLNLSGYSWNARNHWIPYRGTWALDKAQKEKPRLTTLSSPPLKSSSIHRIISDTFQDTTHQIVTISDLTHPELWPIVSSHRVNKEVTATLSLQTIWSDMAYSISKYMYQRLKPENTTTSMNLANFEVFHSVSVSGDISRPRLIRMEATHRPNLQTTDIQWYHASLDEQRSSDIVISATIFHEDILTWQREWRSVHHFLKDRIEALSQKALDGTANRITKNLIYSMFRNIVDYDEIYKGIQSLILDGYEALAEVTLPEKHGNWLAPPHFVENVLQVAGFVMNCGDVFDHRDTFTVFPGWSDLRLLGALNPGEKLRSYVRLTPGKVSREYLGDVFILRADEIIGMCSQMRFRRVPRMLMETFFTAEDDDIVVGSARRNDGRAMTPFGKGVSHPITPAESEISESSYLAADGDILAAKTLVKAVEASQASISESTEMIWAESLRVIARELDITVDELTDETTFAELGVDSLMSLILVQKFLSDLCIKLPSSVFLENPTVKVFKEYLKDS